MIQFWSKTSASNDISFEQQKEATDSATLEQQEIVVDVEGAVVKNGIVHLRENARLQDALIAAGGLASDANRDWVAQHINLAAKAIDGGKLYIPRDGESAPASSSTQNVLSVSDQSSTININSASQSQLEDLPGIGPVTAEKIISQRPYSAISELTEKKVVSQRVFDKIKDTIVAE